MDLRERDGGRRRGAAGVRIRGEARRGDGSEREGRRKEKGSSRRKEKGERAARGWI